MSADTPQTLRPGDYYFTPEGLMVFTEQYHRRRGSCCKNACRHCPWGFGSKKKTASQGLKTS
ncbi:DUF5522 domain-containing protein [Hymenobacter sp. BT491]|uniref:DUF5522 domain-containing protein n=1 Tax=Hymenobacter sp. BT491 TaxID=2766779 RepID=UPI001653C8B1|nr:DUF5522 domain-containing protein [Hymenobacter sp. BT491]MBC6991244.1 hypothetical protein [Hymenobacter sp. BT491]